jgi:hypothetical protein
MAQTPDLAKTVMEAFSAVQEAWQLQLDGIEGMVAETMRRGFTEEQSRAMVAFQFGYRPANPAPPAPEDPADG